MKGKLSLEKRKDGFIFIVFSVESYESCFLCRRGKRTENTRLPGQVDSRYTLV